MSKDFENEDLLKRFEEMLQTNESVFFDLEDFLDIIDEYISLANYHMAHKAIDVALQQYPGNVDILLYRAELFSLEDQLEKAENLLTELEIIDPERIEIPMLEAELYSRKHKHHKAIEALQRALLFPNCDTAEIYELMTIEYLYLEDYRLALDAALKTLEFDPDSSTALYNAITCYDLLDENDEAIRFLQRYVAKEPFSDIGWSLLGKKYLEKKEYQKAIKALDYAIAIDDRFLGAYYDKAFALNKLGQYQKAIDFYNITLQIADPTAFTFYHIARIYEKIEQYGAAIENYLKAINEDPGHYKSWIRLIQVKILLKDIDGALDLTKQAIEIVHNQTLFELLGEIYLLKNLPLKAISAYEMSLKLGEIKLPVILKLSDLYKQTKQLEKYREILLDAKKHFPHSKEIQKRMLGQ